MKYVTMVRLAPGVDNAKKAFEVFSRVGTTDGVQALYAGTDGKTFIQVTETDDADLVNAMTYAPFFESTTIMPVVDLDETWVASMTTALGNIDG